MQVSVRKVRLYMARHGVFRYMGKGMRLGRTAHHVMDHAWELEDRDLSA